MPCSGMMRCGGIAHSLARVTPDARQIMFKLNEKKGARSSKALADVLLAPSFARLSKIRFFAICGHENKQHTQKIPGKSIGKCSETTHGCKLARTTTES
jgi:hypothetical protein